MMLMVPQCQTVREARRFYSSPVLLRSGQGQRGLCPGHS